MRAVVSTYRKPLLVALSVIAVASFFQTESIQADVRPFHSSPLETGRVPSSLSISVDAAAPKAAQAVFFQDRLLSLAGEYVKRDDVPYIWGGGNIGNESSCQQCRECVVKNKIPLPKRLQRCQPCQRCGIDCSHFVYKLYREAGLPYDYASSRELSRQTEKGLIDHYNMVDIGRDLTVAQTGDLLVFNTHIMMLARVISQTRGDFIHVTRFRPGDRHRLGGMRWDRNKDIVNFRGRLVRILRHKRFFADPENYTILKPFEAIFERVFAKL